MSQPALLEVSLAPRSIFTARHAEDAVLELWRDGVEWSKVSRKSAQKKPTKAVCRWLRSVIRSWSGRSSRLQRWTPFEKVAHRVHDARRACRRRRRRQRRAHFLRRSDTRNLGRSVAHRHRPGERHYGQCHHHGWPRPLRCAGLSRRASSLRTNGADEGEEKRHGHIIPPVLHRGA
jgi:hypothetical protein